MDKNIKTPHSWYDSVKKEDLQKVFRLIKKMAPLVFAMCKKKYKLSKRHFNWDPKPKAASEIELTRINTR